MNKIKVLLPTLITSNPYIFELIRSLQVHQDVEVVQYGLQWMKDDSYRFDVVHIQWPEVLFGWEKPTIENLKFLEQTVDKWKNENSKIIATVHNTFPHKKGNEISKDIYKLIYNNCDAIIHFGDASKKMIDHYIDDDKPAALQRVIPHGNYKWFENNVSKESARGYLGIDSDKFMVLVTGRIRDFEELNLLKSVSEYIEQFNGILYVAGRFIKVSKRSVSFYTKVLPLNMKKNVHIEDRYIPDEEMQYFLNAADALFIPRINSLNSGNVPLGFTFGKVVIGNDYGVIGEELKKMGNPVFKLGSDSSLKKALEKSYQLCKTALGKNNKEYAMSELKWSRIADLHVDVYKELL